jgi:hypothetical protein
VSLGFVSKQQLLDAKIMSVRLSLAATGASIHKINNLRAGLEAVTFNLRQACSKAEEARLSRQLFELMDRCYDFFYHLHMKGLPQ